MPDHVSLDRFWIPVLATYFAFGLLFAFLSWRDVIDEAWQATNRYRSDDIASGRAGRAAGRAMMTFARIIFGWLFYVVAEILRPSK